MAAARSRMVGLSTATLIAPASRAAVSLRCGNGPPPPCAGTASRGAPRRADTQWRAGHRGRVRPSPAPARRAGQPARARRAQAVPGAWHPCRLCCQSQHRPGPGQSLNSSTVASSSRRPWSTSSLSAPSKGVRCRTACGNRSTGAQELLVQHHHRVVKAMGLLMVCVPQTRLGKWRCGPKYDLRQLF